MKANNLSENRAQNINSGNDDLRRGLECFAVRSIILTRVESKAADTPFTPYPEPFAGT